MSERLKTSNITNEEVIEDLTKDLEMSLKTGEGDFVVDPDATGDESTSPKEKSSKDLPTASNTFNDETEIDSKYEDSDKESDSDSIDETSLKDAEMNLTEDEKAERQVIAEELKRAGNEAFKVGDFDRSIEKYTEGLRICPLQYTTQRAILYCNRSASKMKLEKYKQAIKDCTKAVELDDSYLKAYYRRAQSYEATDKLDECLADYKKILDLDPSHKEAHAAIIRLPPLIEERNEKLKTEMLGKLKDLGNMILKPFGLSTENFKLEQDPESKGYKINFKQHIMARCRRKRKMCKTRCRTKQGRFKRCRSGDRRYSIRSGCRRRSHRRSRCRRRGRYQWRCRSPSGSFKRCRYCDRRYKIRRRSCSY